MNTARQTQNTATSHLKVVKKSENTNASFDAKIYINTLYPGFSYVNGQGENITPRKCILQ